MGHKSQTRAIKQEEEMSKRDGKLTWQLVWLMVPSILSLVGKPAAKGKRKGSGRGEALEEIMGP